MICACRSVAVSSVIVEASINQRGKTDSTLQKVSNTCSEWACCLQCKLTLAVINIDFLVRCWVWAMREYRVSAPILWPLWQQHQQVQSCMRYWVLNT